MIPYIYSSSEMKGKINTVNCNADLVILDDRKILIISLVDIAIKNKKVVSDIVGNKYSTVELRDRNDSHFKQDLSSWQDSYRYKSDKLDNYTHTVLYSTDIDNYCIDWNNEGKTKIITKWLRNKKYLPITEEIVEQIIKKDYEFEYYSIVKECQVYTNNPMFKNLKVYNVNYHWILEELERLENKEDDYKWDEIETIEDYIFTFLEPIKNKLYQNIRVLYNSKNIDSKMFDSKLKPFKGQVPLIQGGIEVLKRDKFIYLAAEMGVGEIICPLI